MFCACGREITTTSASPWISCTIVDGKVISGICQHGKNFPSIEIVSAKNPFATYKEFVDYMEGITPKKLNLEKT